MSWKINFKLNKAEKRSREQLSFKRMCFKIMMTYLKGKRNKKF